VKTFIRVVELWVPDRTRTRLEYGGGLCSDELSEFRALSENALFAYGEGLPGKAWASGHPVVLTEFANSYFKRTDEAKEASLTCGVALPVFAGEFLTAVLVLFCGDDDRHVGAIELWHNDLQVSHEMGRRLLRHGRHVRIQFAAYPVSEGVRLARPDLEGGHAADHQGPAQFEKFSAMGRSHRNRNQLRRRHSLQDVCGTDLGLDVPVGAGDADRATV
jgi:hypothetical protein